MRSIFINKTQINSDWLDEELRTALGNLIIGISHGGAIVEIHLDDASTSADDIIATDIVNNHDHTVVTAEQQRRIDTAINESDIDTRFDASTIKNKTPAQIYTFIENQIDGWVNLADAQSDLREWLPLMAAAIAWKVQKG